MQNNTVCKFVYAGIFTLAAAFLSNAQAQTTDIAAALDAAAPGDVIEVAPGVYDLVELGPYTFEPAVTLHFDNDATMRMLRLRDVVGLKFDNLTIDAGESFNPGSENAVLVQRGGDITFSKSRFSWAADNDPQNDGTALVFDSVDGARVEGSRFHDILTGLVIRNSQNVEVWGSHFTKMFGDGVVVSGSTNVVIRENACTDVERLETINTHPDCIQLQTGGRAGGDVNVLIADNAILKLSGEKGQGIFVSSGIIGDPHRQITIENNLIRQSIGLGIMTYNTEDLVIRGNLLLPSFDATESPRILVRDPSANVLIEGNTAARIKAPPDAIVQNNTILP